MRHTPVFVNPEKLKKHICEELVGFYNDSSKEIKDKISPEDVEEYIDREVDMLVKDFDEYVHGDTDIPGNLMDITINWNMDNKDKADFKSLIEHIDHMFCEYYREDDMPKDFLEIYHYFQDYAEKWFWEAFGTYALKENFSIWLENMSIE